MSTKLEAMVGYLSGRAGDSQLLDELADPSSEASRFLEATRARSKALLDASPAETASTRSGRRGSIVLAILATAVLMTLGVAIVLIANRLRGLETALDRRGSESLASLRRLEASLGRIAEPGLVDPALGRVEDGLGRLEGRLDRLEKTPNPKPLADPAIGEVREGLNALRRELGAVERANIRQAEELRASVHEVERLLRLMISRGEPAPAAEPSLPNFPKPRPPGGR